MQNAKKCLSVHLRLCEAFFMIWLPTLNMQGRPHHNLHVLETLLGLPGAFRARSLCLDPYPVQQIVHTPLMVDFGPRAAPSTPKIHHLLIRPPFFLSSGIRVLIIEVTPVGACALLVHENTRLREPPKKGPHPQPASEGRGWCSTDILWSSFWVQVSTRKCHTTGHSHKHFSFTWNLGAVSSFF